MALDTKTVDLGGNGNASGAARAERLRHARQAGPGQTPLRKFGRRLVRGHVHKLRGRLDDLRTEDNVEAIHDARIVIRELRAALGMLEEAPEFDAARLRAHRKGLRRLGRLLGETRDLDVLLDRLRTETAAGFSTGELVPMLDLLAHDRDRSNRRLLRELDRPRTERLLQNVRHLGRGKRGGANGQSNGRVPLVRHFAGSAIWRRYEEVLAFEAAMPKADAQTLHQLRISCKHLRYVLEPFVGDTSDHSLITLLKDAQKQLGALHDTVLAAETVQHLGGPGPQADALRQSIQMDCERMQSGVMPLWRRLSGPNTRRSLASFIAAL